MVYFHNSTLDELRLENCWESKASFNYVESLAQKRSKVDKRKEKGWKDGGEGGKEGRKERRKERRKAIKLDSFDNYCVLQNKHI